MSNTATLTPSIGPVNDRQASRGINQTLTSQSRDSFRAGDLDHSAMPWIQSLLLLILATILDEVTGPNVAAAAFYIFPIALAGWRIGWKFSALMAAAAIALNAATIWLDTHHFTRELLASQALQAVVYAAVVVLSNNIRRGYYSLRDQYWQLGEQKDRIESLRRQMADEMQSARTLQELLFVPPPPRTSVEIGTFMAAARILGGDIVDLTYSPSGRHLAVLVADVSGKGTPAALATAVLLGLLEDCPARFESPARALAFLNERLVNRLPDNMFVTMVYLILDLETGEMVWASAGHEPPLLLHDPADGSLMHEIRDLATPDEIGGMALGILEDATYTERRTMIDPDDVLLCYTDGLTDLRLPSGKRLGMEQLRTLLAKHAYLPCNDISEAMLREVTGKSKGQLSSGVLNDDMSIIAIRRTPHLENRSEAINAQDEGRERTEMKVEQMVC